MKRWKTPEWREFRLKVLERDNHTCQRCGIKKEKGLNVHEKKYEKPFKLRNCITLCFDCHRIVDSDFDNYISSFGK